ncbi:MAG: histidine ammonia-lyase [Candidatus Hydrothermae bacterium]|nr:histidine ammonia-lyase [Candidatus Hydrothermae bacterium]
MIEINGKNLSLSDFIRVAEGGEKARLASGTRKELESLRKKVEEKVRSDRPFYGINTGVGRLAEVKIDREHLKELQLNIVRSHAVGVGPPLSPAEVRGAMLLRANTLARGNSGVRPLVVEKLLEFLEENIIPYVPEKGSVGASGDLAPLAHIALALIGEGYVLDQGLKVPSAKYLREKGVKPLELEPKEGLSLINGTQVSTSILALALHRALKLAEAADLIAAMTFEALEGVREEFDKRIWEVRPHPGAKRVMENLSHYTKNSDLTGGEKKRVQDAYSIRCLPQVHGTVRDSLEFVLQTVEREMNSATDNPLVFENGDIISNGNFHGQPVAIAADLLGISLTILSSISERRTFRMLTPELSGLPAFLAEKSGLNAGLMMLQVTQAALVSENKVLSHPASVDSLPTSGDQEDFVSMSMGAALKARQILANTQKVLAIEMISAKEALRLRGPERAADPVKKLYSALSDVIPPVRKDRFLGEDIERALKFLNEEIENYLIST